MVVFTCNYCGESLQKPKVEKHYSFVCRQSKNLTCVDCFKDFRGEEYAAHTKCITEEERYGGIAAAGNVKVKKGEVKQESWIAMVQSILEQEKLEPAHKNLLNAIAQYTNIPRKKVKFINFIQNSMGRRFGKDEVEGVWNIIENHKSKDASDQSVKNKQESEQTVEEKEGGAQNGHQEDATDTDGKCNVALKKEKSKGKKRKSNEENYTSKKSKLSCDKLSDEDIVKERLALTSASDNSMPSEDQTKFNIKERILTILQKRGEMPITKLEKKILNAYKKLHGECSDDSKLIKKIHKKINKLSNVYVDNVTVKLCVNDQ